MPALAIVSPSPLRPTAIAKWPARTGAARRRRAARNARRRSARRNRARSVDESMPTSVAARLAPAAPTSVSAAGVRRKTCAAVTTRPGAPDAARGDRAAPAEDGDGAGADARRRSRRCGRNGRAAGRSAVGSAVLMKTGLGEGWPQGTPPRPAANPPNGGAQPPNWGGRSGFARAPMCAAATRVARAVGPPLTPRAVDSSLRRCRGRARSLESRSLRTGGIHARSPRSLQVVRRPRRRRRPVARRSRAGEIVGLLGPNGAGKSTTVGDAVRPGRRRPRRGLRRQRRARLALDENAHARQAPHRRRAAGALDLREPRRRREPRAVRRALRAGRRAARASASTRRSRSSASPTAPATSRSSSAAA